jgi:hypothetical protein
LRGWRYSCGQSKEAFKFPIRQIMQLLDTFIANEKLRQQVEAKQVA